MDVIGKLAKAGLEGDTRKFFFVTVVPDEGKEWRVGVANEDVRKKATGMVGKRVKATMMKGEKYWGMTDISLMETDRPSSNKDTDWEKVNRSTWRCQLIASVCQMFTGAETLPSPDDIVETCRVLERYVYEPTLAEIARDLVGEEVFPE